MKIAIWTVSVSISAAVLMFGVASLIRANTDDEITVQSAATVRAPMEYVRLCKYNQWENARDLYQSANINSGIMSEGRHVSANTLAYLSEQIAILGVLTGKSWPDMYPLNWPDERKAPTRRQLAETTKWCVDKLTTAGHAWLLLAGVKSTIRSDADIDMVGLGER